MKRGVLYSACRREGYNVLAMGQHLDDLAESFLMSFFNGCLRTMKANYHAEGGDIRVIRPLVYTRERALREYATVCDFPVVNENCPACWDAPQERQRMKQLLASQEHLHPSLFATMLRTMKPLMSMENRAYDAGDDPDCEDGTCPLVKKETKNRATLNRILESAQDLDSTAESDSRSRGWRVVGSMLTLAAGIGAGFLGAFALNHFRDRSSRDTRS